MKVNFFTLFYIKPVKYLRKLRKKNLKTFIREEVLQSYDSDFRISAAFAFGIFMGIIPIWGFQLVTAIFLAYLLKLNKLIVILAANISLPPVIPFILYFSYKTGGIILNNRSEVILFEAFKNLINGNVKDSINNLGYSVVQYIYGSVVLGFMSAIFVGSIVFVVLHFLRKTEPKI